MEKDFQALLLQNVRLLRVISASYAQLCHLEYVYKDSVKKQEKKWNEYLGATLISFMTIITFIVGFSDRPLNEKLIAGGIIVFVMVSIGLFFLIKHVQTKNKREYEEKLDEFYKEINSMHRKNQVLISLNEMSELLEVEDHFDKEILCNKSIDRIKASFKTTVERGKSLIKELKKLNVDQTKISKVEKQLTAFIDWWENYQKEEKEREKEKEERRKKVGT